VIGQPGWPNGLARMINVTNRVHGFYVNQVDVFFYSGDAARLTVFLQDFSRLPDVVSWRLILHEGVGEAKSPWEKVGRPCDWELYGRGNGWKAGGLTNYVLEVHLWSGCIALEKVVVPKNVEIVGAK